MQMLDVALSLHPRGDFSPGLRSRGDCGLSRDRSPPSKQHRVGHPFAYGVVLCITSRQSSGRIYAVKDGQFAAAIGRVPGVVLVSARSSGAILKGLNIKPWSSNIRSATIRGSFF